MAPLTSFILLTSYLLTSIFSGSTNCVTQTLTNFQNFYGPLSVYHYLDLLFSTAGPNAPAIADPPANITCTDCLKDMYTIISKDSVASGLLDAESKNQIATQCGSGFVGTI